MAWVINHKSLVAFHIWLPNGQSFGQWNGSSFLARGNIDYLALGQKHVLTSLGLVLNQLDGVVFLPNLPQSSPDKWNCIDPKCRIDCNSRIFSKHCRHNAPHVPLWSQDVKKELFTFIIQSTKCSSELTLWLYPDVLRETCQIHEARRTSIVERVPHHVDLTRETSTNKLDHFTVFLHGGNSYCKIHMHPTAIRI